MSLLLGAPGNPGTLEASVCARLVLHRLAGVMQEAGALQGPKSFSEESWTSKTLMARAMQLQRQLADSDSPKQEAEDPTGPVNLVVSASIAFERLASSRLASPSKGGSSRHSSDAVRTNFNGTRPTQ